MWQKERGNAKTVDVDQYIRKSTYKCKTFAKMVLGVNRVLYLVLGFMLQWITDSLACLLLYDHISRQYVCDHYALILTRDLIVFVMLHVLTVFLSLTASVKAKNKKRHAALFVAGLFLSALITIPTMTFALVEATASGVPSAGSSQSSQMPGEGFCPTFGYFEYMNAKTLL